MNRKVAFIFVLIGLTALLALNLPFAKSQAAPSALPSPIYILNDGSVSPSTAPIQRHGDTYTLTGNINNTIEVQRSNIAIDGNGFTITKPSAVNTEGLYLISTGYLPGIEIVNESNVEITNAKFDGCVTGITVDSSSDITISQNTIKGAFDAIVVLSGSNVNIADNSIAVPNPWPAGAPDGIVFLPSTQEASNPAFISIEGNLIEGNSSLVSASSQLEPPQQIGVWAEISGCEIASNNFTAIAGRALNLDGSNNLIVGNTFQESHYGILFQGEPTSDFNNSIYWNNFINNTENAVDPFINNPAPNFWDNGTVGNYWSDYLTKYPSATEIDSTGIGNTPYTIAANNIDFYPLIAPFNGALPRLTPIKSPSTAPNSFLSNPNTLFIIAGVAVVVVILASVVFLMFKKRLKTKSTSPTYTPQSSTSVSTFQIFKITFNLAIRLEALAYVAYTYMRFESRCPNETAPANFNPF